LKAQGEALKKRRRCQPPGLAARMVGVAAEVDPSVAERSLVCSLGRHPASAKETRVTERSELGGRCVWGGVKGNGSLRLGKGLRRELISELPHPFAFRRTRSLPPVGGVDCLLAECPCLCDAGPCAPVP